MKYPEENLEMTEGSLVMNYHNNLLRFGAIRRKVKGTDGWSYFEIDFFEDDTYEAQSAFRSKLCGENKYRLIYRSDEIRLVSGAWLQQVADSYGEYTNER
tara:strand:+ start:514 stop:813 length:300 start_codon:yes stop_codon:yes gene_type:complete